MAELSLMNGPGGKNKGIRWQFLGLLTVLIYSPLLPAEGEKKNEVAVARAAVQQETLTGFTRARTQLTLSAEASGKVVEVNGDVGDVIEGDRPFACLDPTFADLEIRANQAEIASLRVDAQHFRKQVRRFSRLLKQNSSSESQLDDAQHSLDKAYSQIEALKVQAETLQERRKRLCVTAPAGWRVIERRVEPGQWVNTGQPLVELGDFSRLLIPFALTLDEYRALLAREQGLTLRLSELNLQVAANIEKISPAFDQASRKIQVELQIADGLTQPRGGLRAELDLQIPLHSGAVLLPSAALQQGYEEHWLTRANGERINVVYLGRVSTADGDWVRITSSQVKPGDRFLIGTR
jgi:RND family efflux transporter MFP subunit